MNAITLMDRAVPATRIEDPRPGQAQGQIAIYVVSLKRSALRRARTEAQMRKARLNFTYVDAVDGSTLPEDWSPWVSPWSKLLKGYPFTAGQLGCWLSHRLAWQAVRERPDGVAVILEDDAVLAPGFANSIREIELATRDVDLVQLAYGADPGVAFRKVYKAGDHDIGSIFGKVNGGFAYLLRSEGAEKLLSVESMHFLNDDWGWYEALTGLRRRGVWPVLATTSREESAIRDVDAAIGPSRKQRKRGWTAKLHRKLMRPLVHAAMVIAILFRRSLALRNA